MDAPRYDAREAAALFDAIVRSRHAVRAFGPEPVPRALIEELLATASCAPSNSNTQPWSAHVLVGAPKQALSALLQASHERDALPPSPHFPDPLPPACGPRQLDFGARYYTALAIAREDEAARARQTARNYDFFGAPVGLLFTIDTALTRYSWADLGMFLQTFMLAAAAHGLSTCPQVSFVRHAPVIRDFLGLAESQQIACGMSLGHADPRAAVNHLQMPREPVEGFARFHGFAVP